MQIPQIGLGTWELKGSSGQKSIETALSLGYRHIDTADWYKNHREVGMALKNSGIPREEIFLVTKIYPPLTRDKILSAGPRFLDELQTNYIDLLLVHWPDATPVPEVLNNFQILKEQGITRYIGVSNFSLSQMEQAQNTETEVYNHQYEIYYGKVDEKMLLYCKSNNISVTAYSPLDEGRLLNNTRLIEIAAKSGVTVAQVALKYLLLKDIVVIPKASSEDHLRENLQSVAIENITLEDFER